jgi:hypothetical protein
MRVSGGGNVKGTPGMDEFSSIVVDRMGMELGSKPVISCLSGNQDQIP